MANRSPLDLHLLDVFATVCRLRSMTLAAQQLGLTQPAISHAVKQLEAGLGVLLIDRSRRPLTPTTSGYWLANAAARILQDTQQIPLTLRQLDRGVAVRLRIGIVDSLAVPFVPLLVKRLKPSIQYLSISAGLARGLRADLEERRLDLILTNDPALEAASGLRCPLITEPYLLAVPNGVEPGPGAAGLARLAEELPFIQWNAQSNIARDIEMQLRRLQLDLPRRFEFDQPGTIMGLVAEGLGFAIMPPLFLFDLGSMRGRVRLLPFPGPAFSRRLDLFARPGEIDTLARRIAEVSRGILRERYLPRIRRSMPWLASEFRVED